MVRDIVIAAVSVGMFALQVRFKAIKQDPRIERPQARGDAEHGGSDWSYIGDVPGSKFSVFTWYKRLMAFYPEGRSDPTAPFFMASDRARPYTYSCAMADLRMFLARVDADTLYGLQGQRVLGYNVSKAGNGEALTMLA